MMRSSLVLGDRIMFAGLWIESNARGDITVHSVDGSTWTCVLGYMGARSRIQLPNVGHIRRLTLQRGWRTVHLAAPLIVPTPAEGATFPASSGWRWVRLAAMFMPPSSGERWLAEVRSFIAEAPSSMAKPGMRSYLASVPQVIAVSWWGVLTRRPRRASNRSWGEM